MKDGNAAVGDWLLLNAMLNVAGARPGYRCITTAGRHGLLAALRHRDRLRRHCRGSQADCAGDVERSGHRHDEAADAGYEIAVECAKEQGLKLPMVRRCTEPMVNNCIVIYQEALLRGFMRVRLRC
jgi:urocanate hydratase